MASEQFSLCWDNFHKNMSSGMNSLLENEDLVDVTLAVEGKYLKAHKMVLSVCSPYFRELFKVNPCKHPIVFMKDVSYVAMSDLLQFMYQGEVQVSQENLTTFIKTAEALQIKGLTGDGNGSNECDTEQDETNTVEVEPPKPVVRQARKIQSSNQQAKRPRLSTPEQSSSSPSLTKTEPVTIPSNATNNENLIQFKMEPYDQGQSSISITEEHPDETFNDETLDDNNPDDGNEDYSLMEGGDEEPKAGTSADGTTGEGQDEYVPVRYGKRSLKSGIIINGFTYHQNTVKKDSKMRYLLCAEYKRLACKARAQIPIGGSISDVVLRREHNHPPFQEASIKGDFLTVLKTHIDCRPTAPLKQIYEGAAILYLGCAEHKRSGCRGRATIPVGGTLSMLKMTQPHNHPPDVNAEEKDAFLKELKVAVQSTSMEKASLKKVYETVALVYPKAAEEISFKNVSSSLHRWRKIAQLYYSWKYHYGRICINGHFFLCSYKNRNRWYLRCVKQKKLGCRSRACLLVGQPIEKAVVFREHNHSPDKNEFDCKEFMRLLKLAVRNGGDRSFQNIYDGVAEMFPNVAKLKRFEKVRPSMRRWRRTTDLF